MRTRISFYLKTNNEVRHVLENKIGRRVFLHLTIAENGEETSVKYSKKK